MVAVAPSHSNPLDQALDSAPTAHEQPPDSDAYRRRPRANERPLLGWTTRDSAGPDCRIVAGTTLPHPSGDSEVCRYPTARRDGP